MLSFMRKNLFKFSVVKHTQIFLFCDAQKYDFLRTVASLIFGHLPGAGT